MSARDSFHACVKGLEAGDQRWAELVWRRFEPKLRVITDRRLSPTIKRKVDADDVLQSAFRSFFVHAAQGRFRLESWYSVWRLLLTIAQRKCTKQKTRFLRGRRQVEREVPFCTERVVDTERAGRDATPSTNAMMRETLALLAEKMGERDLQVLHMFVEGHGVPEIAQQLARSQRSVQRALRRVRETLGSKL